MTNCYDFHSAPREFDSFILDRKKNQRSHQYRICELMRINIQRVKMICKSSNAIYVLNENVGYFHSSSLNYWQHAADEREFSLTSTIYRMCFFSSFISSNLLKLIIQTRASIKISSLNLTCVGFVE